MKQILSFSIVFFFSMSSWSASCFKNFEGLPPSCELHELDNDQFGGPPYEIVCTDPNDHTEAQMEKYKTQQKVVRWSFDSFGKILVVFETKLLKNGLNAVEQILKSEKMESITPVACIVDGVTKMYTQEALDCETANRFEIFRIRQGPFSGDMVLTFAQRVKANEWRTIKYTDFESCSQN